MEPRRVLHVLASGAVGGGSSHVRDLVTGGDRRAFTPFVAVSDDGPLADELRARGVSVLTVSMTRRVNPLAGSVLGSAMRRLAIDVVHAHGTRAALAAMGAARRAGLPLVYTAHGWSFHTGRLPGSVTLALALESRLAHVARRVICVSESDRRLALDHGILVPERCVVIPNGVHGDRFVVEPDTRARLRRELGLDESHQVVAEFARLTRQKGQAILLEATRQLVDRFPALRVLVVGEGPDRTALEATVAATGLQERVRFLGARSDVPALLAACDLVALPSLWEGLPLAVLEAMAAGVPVVASAVDGAVEVLQGGCGALVPPTDVPALAGAIAYLLQDPAARARMGAMGRERVKERYDADRMIRATEEVHASLLARLTTERSA